MRVDLMCSFHTTSGVLPGSLVASRFPLAERLAACAEAGYDGYWFHWRDYLAQKAAGLGDGDIRALFDRYGMRHRGVEFLADWFLDEAPARANESAAFAAAEAIGATVLNVGGDFSDRGIATETMTERFEALCTRAATRGISIALEIVPWSNVPDLRSALLYLSPSNAGLVIDAWHVFRGGIALEEIAALPPEKVCCVQINDADAAIVGDLPEDTRHRKNCGEGVFDLAGFIDALRLAGVAAPFSVEVISAEQAALPVRGAARLSFDCAKAVVDKALSQTFAVKR